MIVCPHCQHLNPEAATHCQACGQALSNPLYRACGSCGALNALERTHCSHCLSPLIDPLAVGGPPEENPSIPEENLWAADPLAEIAPLLPLPEIPERPSAAPSNHAPTEEEKAAAALLHRIATEPAPLGPARHEPPKGQAAVPSRAVRLILWLGVLLAGLLPFLPHDAVETWVTPRPQVAQAAEALGRLDSGAYVLIAVDYSPAYASELTPLLEKVLQDLGRRSVRLIVVSTHPEGVGVARQALARVAAGLPEWTYGEQFLILGFLPGEERGLRLLTQDFSRLFSHDDIQQRPLADFALMQGVQTLESFDAVLLFTEQGPSARRWIEQVTMQTTVPTWVFATTRVEPLLMPYFQGGQVAGLVGGAYGALEYPSSDGRPHALRGAEGYAALLFTFVLAAVFANLPRRSSAKAK